VTRGGARLPRQVDSGKALHRDGYYRPRSDHLNPPSRRSFFPHDPPDLSPGQGPLDGTATGPRARFSASQKSKPFQDIAPGLGRRPRAGCFGNTSHHCPRQRRAPLCSGPILEAPLPDPRPRWLHRCPGNRRSRTHHPRQLPAPQTAIPADNPVLKINQLQTITDEVVETAASILVIGN
jgi:hypothetical protein